MKTKQFKKFSTLLLLSLIVCALGTLSTAHSATSTSQERALSFVSNVLPFDMTKYSAAMTQYVMSPSSTESPTTETVDYTLQAKDSTLIASCSFTDSVFTGCLIISQTGSVLQSATSNNLVDSAKSFLDRYQAFTGENLSEMVNTLAHADSSKNMTTSAGNIKLQISSQSLDSKTVDTIFRWTNTINGADYTALGVTFRNGNFYALRDDRGLYKIGNTDVNVTQNQAIDLALKYIGNYSYQGITGSDDNPQYVAITGFNVTKENITTQLSTSIRESSALYPYWSVQLPLKENYPGNVWALLVSVWADSGQVFLCQPLATGGSVNDNPISEAPTSIPSTSQPTATTGQSSLGQNDTKGQDTNVTTIIIAIVAIFVAAATVTIAVKRRSR
jgi:hypothetical protein